MLTDFPSDLRDIISKKRDSKGISQDDMAMKINKLLPEGASKISQKSYSNIENGTIKRPKSEYLQAIAEILEMQKELEKYISKPKEVIALGKRVPMRLKEEEFADAFPDWKGLPFYNTPVTASFVETYRDEHVFTPQFFVRDPRFKDCDFAAIVTGDSMHSEIRHGDYIICKEIVDRRFIVYGDIYYVIATNGLETCKYINADTEDRNNYMLVAKNEHISPAPLPKDMVLKLYKVKGILRGY